MKKKLNKWLKVTKKLKLKFKVLDHDGGNTYNNIGSVETTLA